MPEYHLAQSNIARMRGAIDDDIMQGFVERLEPLNQLADESNGFIWRMQDEAGDATAIRVFDDERILFNMSVWASIDALEEYVYRSNHVGALQRRAEWFEPMPGATFVLWWIPAGHIPSVEEAKSRFDILQANGPSGEAFTFRRRFAPNGNEMPAKLGT